MSGTWHMLLQSTASDTSGAGGEGTWLGRPVQGPAGLPPGHSSVAGHLLLFLLPAAPVGGGPAAASAS